MGILIILNIILIALLLILIFYIIRNYKFNIKRDNVKDDKCCKIEKNEKKEIDDSQKNNLESERVFIGRFVDEEEYQQLTKNRKSYVSVLLKEFNDEYEHFKELNK
jgi:type III secretory pathway component EscR